MKKITLLTTLAVSALTIFSSAPAMADATKSDAASNNQAKISAITHTVPKQFQGTWYGYNTYNKSWTRVKMTAKSYHRDFVGNKYSDPVVSGNNLLVRQYKYPKQTLYTFGSTYFTNAFVSQKLKLKNTTYDAIIETSGTPKVYMHHKYGFLKTLKLNTK